MAAFRNRRKEYLVIVVRFFIFSPCRSHSPKINPKSVLHGFIRYEHRIKDHWAALRVRRWKIESRLQYRHLISSSGHYFRNRTISCNRTSKSFLKFIWVLFGKASFFRIWECKNESAIFLLDLFKFVILSLKLCVPWLPQTSEKLVFSNNGGIWSIMALTNGGIQR